jgi:hypothetical protein
MKVIYRISDGGYAKEKPDYVDNEKCLFNAKHRFGQSNIHVIADGCGPRTMKMIKSMFTRNSITKVQVGHGAGTFNIALDMALNEFKDQDYIYFLENDYIHKGQAREVLQEGIDLGASFVALYDHPDKYLEPSKGGNPYCEGGAEDTRVYLTNTCHWKVTNSTTMTFAARVDVLRETEPILRKWTTGTYPEDFKMFLELRETGHLLVSSIPGFSTHGETAWLSPLTDWSTQ